MSDPASVGIDAGSTTFKAVAIDRDGRILASFLEPADPRIEEQAARALVSLGAPAGIPVGATGYGRRRVNAAKVLTEITCHARGAFSRTRETGILVDVGGQDTKVVRVGPGGAVLDFAMNDKCAAGTGRFLEVILGRLRIPQEEVARYAARSTRPVPVTSTCTVFAESEVVSLVARGEPVEDIVKGLHAALASRVASLVGHGPARRQGVHERRGRAEPAPWWTPSRRSFPCRSPWSPTPSSSAPSGAALSALASKGRKRP